MVFRLARRERLRQLTFGRSSRPVLRRCSCGSWRLLEHPYLGHARGQSQQVHARRPVQRQRFSGRFGEREDSVTTSRLYPFTALPLCLAVIVLWQICHNTIHWLANSSLLRLEREHRFEFDPNASQLTRIELSPLDVHADKERHRIGNQPTGATAVTRYAAAVCRQQIISWNFPSVFPRYESFSTMCRYVLSSFETGRDDRN